MKNMKKKGLILAGLSVLCLSSVGFASWVISQDAEKSTGGNLTAEGISDRRVNITKLEWSTQQSAGFAETAPTVHYGFDSSKDGQATWLTHEGGKESALEFYLKVTVDDAKKLATTGALTFTVAEKTPNQDGYVSKNLASSQYITMPTIADIDAASFEGNSAVAKVTFGWGAAFNNSCPEDFFNGTAATDDTPEAKGGKCAEYAATHLAALEEELKGAQFTVTVTAHAKAGTNA